LPHIQPLSPKLRSAPFVTESLAGRARPNTLSGIIATEPEAPPIDLTIQTKDGCQRLCSSVAAGTQSGERQLFNILAQEVSERKAYKELIHLLLMREVDHRAKNMFAPVQAIAPQIGAGDAEGFIGRFAEQLQALAATQDLLERDERWGVHLKDSGRAHLTHFADIVGSRITARSPKLHLNAAIAPSIVLGRHALATNAGKWPAVLTSELHSDALTIVWIDGPPARPPKRQGFGHRGHRFVAKRTVNGEVQLDYVPSILSGT
jgi:two-component sensor histidine kinase